MRTVKGGGLSAPSSENVVQNEEELRAPKKRRDVMKQICMVIMVFFIGLSFPVHGQDLAQKVKGMEVLADYLESTKVDLKEVRDLGSLYELVVDKGGKKNILYLTKDGQYIIFGRIFDKSRQNLTQDRLQEVSKIDFSKIRLDDAIQIRQGSGTKKLVMVTDVHCPYCRKAFTWLKGQKDFTLYVFLFPLDSYPKSKEKSVRILCSKDPASALELAKADKDIAADRCAEGEKKLERQIKAAQEMEISGTPLFVLEDGTKIGGFNQQALEKYLK